MALRASETPSFPRPSRSTSSLVMYLRSSLSPILAFCEGGDARRSGAIYEHRLFHLPSSCFRDNLLIGIVNLRRVEAI
jgi:hypothetical protein